MLSLYLSMVETEEQRSLVEQIYYDCEQVMYRTAYSVLHNKQDAEDAVHDAFLRIIADIDRIAGIEPGKRKNYAVIVSRNTAIDRYRRNKKQVDIEDIPDHEDDGADIERMAFGGYNAETLNETLSRLPEDYREALIMHYYHDMTLDSIAAALGISYDATKSKLFRARKKLYELLKDGEDRDL